ncbi:MAG: OmpA family protein [Bacteroidia bacterium]
MLNLLLLLVIYAQPTYKLLYWWEVGKYEKILMLQRQSFHVSSAALPYLAGAHAYAGNSDEALALYHQFFRDSIPTCEPTHLYLYAELLYQKGDHANARNYYELFLKHTQDESYRSLVQTKLQWLSNPLPPPDSLWKIHRHPLCIKDWEAGLIKMGDSYYFTRRSSPPKKHDRTQKPYEGIYVYHPHRGIQALSTGHAYHEAVAGKIGDTLLIYLSKGKGRIYTWVPPAKPARLTAFKNLKGHVCSAFYDPQTGDIYFAAEEKSKNKDLYWMQKKSDGTYAPPQNLHTLNTPYDEDNPFLLGDTLYFAHNGPTSFGGYDIYFSIRQAGGWSAPHHLPPPINSRAHEWHISFYQEKDTLFAYLSSERAGIDNSEIYILHKTRPQPPPPPIAKRETLPPPTPQPKRLHLQGYVRHAQSKKTVPNAQILILDKETQKELYATLTDLEGRFSLFLPIDSSYYMYVQAPGYISYVDKITDSQTDKEILLHPIEMRARFELRQIYFDFNSDKLRPESTPELWRLYRLLQENPHIRIRFSGHTDNIGNAKYNQDLSERRARAVHQWLKIQGIEPIQMEYIGYGKTRPVASNDTPQGRALNRRIEMEIVGILPSTSKNSGKTRF